MADGARTVRTKRSSSWSNPWIMLTAGLGMLALAVGLVVAVQAHQQLLNVTWDGADVDAARGREDFGQKVIVIGSILCLAWIVLLGVRWEADRVIAAVRRTASVRRDHTS